MDSQETEVNLTPIVAKPETAMMQPSSDQTDAVSIDLTNKKQDSSQLDMLDAQANKLFSKTATNELLAVSNGMSSFNPEGQIMVTNLLDSQTSSPTMKPEVIDNVASFGNSKIGSVGNSSNQRRGALNAVANQQQQEVLATSGPGQVSHLKSSSASNANYLSNMQVVPQPSGGNYQEHQMASSQGRATETWHKMQGVHPLDNQAQAKSAVLNPNPGSNKNDNAREIRKIPSKKTVTTKKKRIHRQEQQAQETTGQFTSDAERSTQQKVHSASTGKHQPRHSSHTNRAGHYPIDSLQNSTQGNTVQNTPVIPGGSNQAMYPPPPMPTGDQYHGFSFITPIQQSPFQFQGMPPGLTAQQQQQILATSQMGFAMQPQPQVHFIAKQQKFYGISPERAPLVFKQNSQDKRPYTSSGHVLNKRVTKQSQQNNAIAALYLGSKTHQNGFGISQANGQPRNQSQPVVEDGLYRNSQLVHANPTQAAYSMQQIPHKGANFGGPKTKGASQSNSAHVYRKDKNAVVGTQAPYVIMGQNNKMPEQLQEEVMKLKQTANTHKEENIKLKTKIKILENEMGRKERTLEDFLQQNQFIQNAQKNGNSSTLAPIVQTAQRYQAETFLVMSLKKQVKEQKSELAKKEEELSLAKRNIKNTKFFEMDQELKLYRDELIRLRYLLEQAYQHNETTESQPMTGRPSAQGLPSINPPNATVQTQNMSQPSIMGTTGVSSGVNFKQTTTNSQSNFYPDTNSNFSHQGGNPNYQQQQPNSAAMRNESKNLQHQQTLSNEDQVSNDMSEQVQNTSSNFQALKSYISNTPATPLQSAPPINMQQMSVDQQFHNQSIQGVIDPTRESELFKHMTSQLSDKDQTILHLQSQLEELSKSRPQRPQGADGKGGSAGPSVKSELQKMKKQLREKEKEIMRLKTEQNNHISQQSVMDEEQEKKVKQLQSQLSQSQKQAKELKSDMKKKDDLNEQLTADLAKEKESHKQQQDKQKKELSQAQNELKKHIGSLTEQVEESEKENARLNKELEATLRDIADMKISKEAEAELLSSKTDPKKEDQEESKAAKEKPDKKKNADLKLEPKVDGELGLVSTVLGCRENRDRIEFAFDLKEFVQREGSQETNKKEEKMSHLGLASDYKLKLSDELVEIVNKTEPADLAKAMPKYDFISPNLAMIIMNEVRRMLMEPELVEILNEKDTETRLPFDALRDLCSRFDKILNDEHCAFITASYLTEIDEAIIFINFKEFLADLKDPRGRELDITSSRNRPTSSIGSEGSDSEIRRLTRARENSPLSDMLNRSAGKGALSRMRKSVDEEHMLDVAEAIFIKLADLMTEKGRSVRGIFTKYAEPEIFPDRTVLELLSPRGFLQGIKEAGIDDLQEFEVACLMRVLSKPELDSAVILNEFVMIMENFGVLDQGEEEDCEDYIPDTEQSVQSVVNPDEESKADGTEAADKAKKDEAKKQSKSKDKKKRVHDLKNIDTKGLKILRKLARFLLKQFLHPREFFGKAIQKQTIKTKKREFYLDTLTFKEFYLRIKIANIRKRLTENQSLNDEICLDKKAHKDIINVKLMVKALEEVAEEEQKVLLQEEKAAAEEKASKKEIDGKKDTIGTSDVETPRSESADKLIEAGADDEEKKEDSEKSSGGKKKETAKESYGIDAMKFGNSSIRGKSSSHSPLIADRAFQQLNTIEEEKHETQTSNYMESASERENSKLLSSNNLRNSQQLVGLEFEEETKNSAKNSAKNSEKPTKMSPELINKSLLRDERMNSASQVVSPTEIDKVDAPIELATQDHSDKQGRLTGRASSWKDNLIAKSLKESDENRFKDKDDDDDYSDDAEEEVSDGPDNKADESKKPGASSHTTAQEKETEDQQQA